MPPPNNVDNYSRHDANVPVGGVVELTPLPLNYAFSREVGFFYHHDLTDNGWQWKLVSPSCRFHTTWWPQRDRFPRCGFDAPTSVDNEHLARARHTGTRTNLVDGVLSIDHEFMATGDIRQLQITGTFDISEPSIPKGVAYSNGKFMAHQRGDDSWIPLAAEFPVPAGSAEVEEQTTFHLSNTSPVEIDYDWKEAPFVIKLSDREKALSDIPVPVEEIRATIVLLENALKLVEAAES